MEILHFNDLVDTECRLTERSCSGARRVSNCNSNVPQGVYPHIKLHCNILGIDNDMPLKHTERHTASIQ